MWVGKRCDSEHGGVCSSPSPESLEGRVAASQEHAGVGFLHFPEEPLGWLSLKCDYSGLPSRQERRSEGAWGCGASLRHLLSQQILPKTSPSAQENSNGETRSKNRISGGFPHGPRIYPGGSGALRAPWMSAAPLWKGLPP